MSYRAIYDVVHGRGFIAGEGSDGFRTNVRSMIKRIRQKFREVDDHFEEIENYPGFGYRWRPAEEAAPAVTEQRAGMNGQNQPRPPASGGHGPGGVQAPNKVVDAISQLPFVRSVATWRRRRGPDDETVMRLGQALPTLAPRTVVTTAGERQKVAAMTGHSTITGSGRDDTA